MTKQDCYNKRKKLGWNVSRHAEDAVSVDLLVKELQNENHNPILLYKPQGIVDPTGLYLHYKLNFNKICINNMHLQ